MSEPVIRKEDRPLVEGLEQLMFCNPFLPERTELERELLGPDFVETPHPRHVRTDDPAEDENLSLLVKRAGEAAKRCRARLEEQGVLPEDEIGLYYNLVCFHLYYRYRDSFSDYIELAWKGGGDFGGKDLYDAVRTEAEAYGLDRGAILGPSFAFEHLFAFGFQIRRAYYFIYQFLVGTSAAVTALRARIWQSIFTHDMRRYRRSLVNRMGDITTLITGPSGSGKELVARAVACSRFIPYDVKKGRFAQEITDTFFPLNLSALTPTLIESELFGHRKGSFTGALADHPGYLETCGPHGTVFLDEIGDVDTSIQVKLLRVLQTRRFNRLGDTNSLPFEGKLIAATNRPLTTCLEEECLRRDFYYRLCADQVETPSLQEILSGNPAELDYLVRHIAVKVAGEEEADQLTGEVCSWVRGELGPDYSWPGNFRELEQCVRNIMVHREYRPEAPPVRSRLSERLQAGTLSADELLREYVTRLYARLGTYEDAGERLGMDPRTVKKYVDPVLFETLGRGGVQ